MTDVRLTAKQLNELELVRAGAYGRVMRYELPQGTPHVATLLVSDLAPGATVTLLDTEATPVATVHIEDMRTERRGTWLSGEVSMLREPATPSFPELRPTAQGDPFDQATLLLGRSVGRIDTPVILVDRGDAHALAKSVRSIRSDGLDVRVLPEPEAQHLNASDRAELLAHLASVVFSSNVRVIRGEDDKRGDGLVVLFTGLSGSGKTTIARQLTRRLRAESAQRVTLLDGDEVRAMLSSGLGFTREDRELNVRRIGWVATQISAHGGIAICAAIAPYEVMREGARAMAEEVGRFVLVHVATPLQVCEARDRKGLYAKARAGEIKAFTGISDPFEEPAHADVVVGAEGESVEAAVESVLAVVAGRVEANYVI